MPKLFRIFTLSGLLLVSGLGLSTAQAAFITKSLGTPGNTSMCLDVRAGNPANFTPVVSQECNATFAQVWNLRGPTLESAIGPKCLDVANAGTANGTLVQLFQCNGTAAQRWQYSIRGELINTNSNKCLDVGNGAPLQQATIQTCGSNTSGQVWIIR